MMGRSLMRHLGVTLQSLHDTTVSIKHLAGGWWEAACASLALAGGPLRPVYTLILCQGGPGLVLVALRVCKALGLGSCD